MINTASLIPMSEGEQAGSQGLDRRTLLTGAGVAALIAALGPDLLRPSSASAAPSGYVQPFTAPIPGITTHFNELDRLDWDPPQPDHRHKGADYSYGADGRTVRAIAAGSVASAYYDNEYGYNVILNHAGGISSRYGHLRAGLPVAQGQNIAAGQTVGVVGDTGLVTGPHLHLEIRVDGVLTDPVAFLNGSSTDPTQQPMEATVALAIAQVLRSGVGAHYLFVSPTRVSLSQELSTLSPVNRSVEDNIMRAIAEAAGYPAGYNPPLIDDTPYGGWYIRNQIAGTIAGMPPTYPLSPSNPYMAYPAT